VEQRHTGGGHGRHDGLSGRDSAYRTIRRQIIDLTLPPGAALSENELAGALHLSRTPVREAIVLLTNDRLVQVYPKVGTFVSRVDPAEVAEAQFLREAVELASMRSLVAPFDQGILDRIRANLAAQDAVGDDVTGFFDLDEAFHVLLMALAGHAASWSAVAAAKGHLDRARMLGLTSIPSVTNRIDEHHAITDAVTDGHCDQAVTLLRTHLRNVFGDITRIKLQHPELFVTDPAAAPTPRSAVAGH
jgi:DNA-binding GntR family transcriptional regulator